MSPDVPLKLEICKNRQMDVQRDVQAQIHRYDRILCETRRLPNLSGNETLQLLDS